MNFLKKAVFCYIAPLLSISSMTATSLEAQVCDSPCIDWCSLLVPGLVGAAAGAATAAAIKNRGKHGKRGEHGPRGEQGDRGERGPPGDNPFIRDVRHSLSFEFELSNMDIGDSESISGGIRPFVSTPEGHIFTGTPFEIDNFMSSRETVITVGSPVYGTYTFGFEFTGHSSNITFDYDLEAKPSDGREDTAYQGTETLSATGETVQFSFDYTYGPRGTVPEDSSSSSSSSLSSPPI